MEVPEEVPGGIGSPLWHSQFSIALPSWFSMSRYLLLGRPLKAAKDSLAEFCLSGSLEPYLSESFCKLPLVFLNERNGSYWRLL